MTLSACVPENYYKGTKHVEKCISAEIHSFTIQHCFDSKTTFFDYLFFVIITLVNHFPEWRYMCEET